MNITKSLLVTFLTLIWSIAYASNIEDLIKKATSGDSNAQFQLGAAYDFGHGVEQNIKEASKWYLKAAEKGHTDAQNIIGSLYQAGEGVEQDYKKAFMWYSKAAKTGHAEANNNLAYMYDFGLGVPEDNGKAIEYYNIAAEKGSLRAIYNLGHEFGKKENYAQAYQWFEIARFYTQSSKDMNLKWRIRGILEELESEMSADEIDASKQQAHAWIETHRK